MKTKNYRNCEGCQYEFEEAINYQDDEGLYYATTIEQEFCQRKHFIILMVNDEGEVQVW
jgi:hypothetical protein